MSSQEKYLSLRKAFPRFVFESYKYNVQPDGLHIMFSFQMGEHRFHPCSFIPSRPFLSFDQPGHLLDDLVFNIGMIELISYWKSACPPLVEIPCGHLDNEQCAFWRKLYWNGLGEFFYINGISDSPDTFLTLQVTDTTPEHPCATPAPFVENNQFLLPIGGGKDSVVSLEVLKSAQVQRIVPLIMNPRGATLGCIQAAGFSIDDVLVIHRSIDPLLLDLNAQGFLNGHTPFSAMLAFYTLLAAQLSGIPNIALSNENSANETTVAHSYVNHQYSKSLEFENDFRCYVRNWSTEFSRLNYFSLLRPLSELQIAMLFSRYERYFDVFRSCNVGSKQDIWCGHCPKCLFAYIILSPFIQPSRLNAIFGKCLLDDLTLRQEFLQLIGRADTKPFECVGTVSEVNSALSMTLSRWYSHSQPPALLTDYHPLPPVTPLATLASSHNVPHHLLAHLSSLIALCLENNS